ncbi:hypothetical protein PRIPAC_70203, partial [Pristionchus pacificus]|uniref:Uncharacterized protein n=1 Tax=Pristionchus pacificus TaxID=54126 RepID=A0A2A6BG88_PRIPA
MTESRVVWRREDPPAYERYIQKRSTPSGFVKVPDNRLATILENYLVKSETKCLKIVDMIFSAQFFEDSVKMCRNQDDFRVVFDDSEVDKNYPDLYRWHWPNWPSPPPLVSLLYSVSSLSFINTDFCQLITETYFIFGYGVKSKGKSLEVKNDDHCKYNNFHPSTNIVDVLVLFKYFKVPYLTLPSGLITDFLVKATENTETKAKWIFSLSSFLSYDDKLAIRNKFEVHNLRGGESDGMDFKLISHKHNKIIEGQTKPYRGNTSENQKKIQMIE